MKLTKIIKRPKNVPGTKYVYWVDEKGTIQGTKEIWHGSELVTEISCRNGVMHGISKKHDATGTSFCFYKNAKPIGHVHLSLEVSGKRNFDCSINKMNDRARVSYFLSRLRSDFNKCT